MASRACETCGAQVLDQDARKHDEWHKRLRQVLTELRLDPQWQSPLRVDAAIL